jgi:hypothetical protein
MRIHLSRATFRFLPICLVLTALLPGRGGAYSTTDLAYIPSKWGFIDREGKVVVEAVYTRVEGFSEGLAAVKEGGTHFIGGKWGYIDRDGTVAIEPTFDQARSFREGLASVLVDGKWGVIDHGGAWVVEPQYGLIGEFREGLAGFVEHREGDPPFPSGGAWGYLDRKGKVVIEPRFASVNRFGEGLAAVAPGRNAEGFPGPWGFIDRGGRMVIEPQFDGGGVFSEGLAAVKQDGLYGYIDRAGAWAIRPQFHFSWRQDFRDGLAVVRISEKGEEMAVIDKSGTILRGLGLRFDCGVRYDPATGTLTGLFADWENRKGDAAEAPFDPERTWLQEGLIGIFQCEQGLPVAGQTLNGFADAAGKVVIPPRFENVEGFREGRAAFAVDIDWKAGEDAFQASEQSGNWFF